MAKCTKNYQHYVKLHYVNLCEIYKITIKNLHQNEKIALNMFLVTIIKLSKDLLYLNLKEGFMHSPKNVLGSQSLLFFSNTNIHVCNTSTELKLKIFSKKRFVLDKMFYQNTLKTIFYVKI